MYDGLSDRLLVSNAWSHCLYTSKPLLLVQRWVSDRVLVIATLTVGTHRVHLPPKLQGKPCVNGQPAGYTPAEPGFPRTFTAICCWLVALWAAFDRLLVIILADGKLTVRGCADYIECRDVTNASSCRAFDANNNEITDGDAVAAPLRIDRVDWTGRSGSEPGDGGQPDVVLSYAAGEAAVRLEATVFEWSQARLGPF